MRSELLRFAGGMLGVRTGVGEPDAVPAARCAAVRAAVVLGETVSPDGWAAVVAPEIVPAARYAAVGAAAGER